jgi:alpha-tubulin suppressor-like RCC1 family protein
MGSCSSETLGYGGYAGLSFAPAGATTTVAGNNATGTITVSYPDKVATTLVPTSTNVKSAPITFTLTFAETVTGLTASDFRITGTATGCSVATVPAGTTTYTITVTGCAAPAGSKTLILTLPVDSATTSTSRGNAAVTAATVTLDDAAPTVTITGPSPVAQTAAFDFTITGNETITGLAVADFSLAGGTCTIDTVTGSGSTWLVHVIGCTNGNVTTLTLKASSLTDLAGNTAPAAAKTLAETVDIPPAPVKLTDAVITGTTSNGLLVGDTLTVSGATFSPANHGNVVYNTNTFVWYRCYAAQATASSSVASDCQVITGATTASYRITQNDIGYFIRGAMVATNSMGTVFSASANSPVVREYDPLSASWYATCVVKEGLVYCWGDNAYGQMGDGTTVDVLAPNAQPVKLANGNNLTGVVSVDTGSEHTCALTNQGAMYCWGRNNWSQLGDGTTVSKSVATPVTAVAAGSVGFGSDVVAISAGEADTCVLKVGGAAYCWGVNDYGQMADGTSTTKVTPTRVLSAVSTPLTNITDIEANRYNVCVLSNSGSVTGQVYCAGHGGNGQMGNGTVTATNTYLTKAYTSATDATFTGATDISVSSHHICAVRNGAAYCWGINTSGQLGTGNASSQSYPTIPIDTAAGVSFASGITQVETSKNSTGSSCFLKSTGILYCSGLGTSGQLTDGTIVSKTTSVASTLFTTGTWTMSIGELFTCGIDASGLSCIGNNNNGQLGNGTIVNSTTTEVTQPMFAAHLGAVDEKPVAGGATETGYAGTGQLLTGATTVEAATGSWYGYPLPVLTYQWWRCTATGAETTTAPADCTLISGATAKTYTPVAADVGKYLRFEVIGTNSAGVTGDWSATTAAVGVAPTNTALPTIALKAGSAGTIVGTQAIATAGTWSGTPTPTSSFIWYRCTTAGATATLTAPSDCVQISDATGATYTFTASDVGYYVRGVDVGQSTAGINYAFTATVGPVAGSRTIAAGFNHTCVIKLGYVYCWGYNGYGNLGDGTLVDTKTMPTTPVKLADGSYLKNVESIDASANSTCALTSAGAMYCWGYNGYGNLGDGTTTNRSIPTPVTGMSSGVSYIATGISTCAVKTDGSLFCWGYNANGQLGDNTATQRNTPVQVITAANTPITNVIQVSLGWQHTCAIKVGGALFCWGYNGNGMIGDNSTSNRWMPTQVTGMTSGVTDVSAGYYYTCAVKNSAAFCWGYNANGQLGDASVTQRLTPVAVADSAATPAISFTSGVTDVEASDYDPGYTCFIKQSQKVYCTGANAQGQLGTSNTTEFRVPSAPSLFSGSVTGAALGRYHTCVIMDLKVSCIGYNANGELANGNLTSTSTVLSTQTSFGNPTGALDVVPVSGGATETGYAGTGQLLTGATILDPITGTWFGYSYPTLTYQWWSCTSAGAASATTPSGCSVISGATSLTYTPVAGDTGKFLRFEVIGTNSAGTTLAFSATSASVGVAPANTALPGITSNSGSAGVIVGNSATAVPGTWSGTPAPGLTYKWYRCSTSDTTATLTNPTNCVVIDGATGSTYTYTASDVGSYIRGIEVAESSSGIAYAYTPTAPGPVRQSNVIVSGYEHNCVIKAGFVYCWGYNNHGQLGDGTTTNATSVPSTPVKLADGSYLKDVVSISAGTYTTCALTVPGAVYCWGSNQYGQLGDGTTTDRLIPTPVTTTTVANGSISFQSGVSAIAVGTHQTCAVKNGAVYCWGFNSNGQLGDATTVNKSVPTPSLVVTSGVTQINSQDQTICAIKAGALYCWGYNNYYQMADGTITSRSTPQLVPGMTAGVTDVDLGFSGICAIKSGALFCWGYNWNYVLGDGTSTNRTTPNPVAATASGVAMDSQVVDITVSDHYSPAHACAIKQDGKAYCWGDNTYGQLGDLTTTAAMKPVLATGFAGKVSGMALSYVATCGIVDGSVKCVGHNAVGELGNGLTANLSTPFAIPSLANYLGGFDTLPVSGGATLSGYTGVGQVLTGATTLDPVSGTWLGYSYPVLTYQWLRCLTSGVASATVPSDCKPISGATSINYTATALDVGKYLRIEVIGTNSAGVAIAVSATPATTVGLSPTNTALPNLVDSDGGYAGVIPGVVEMITAGSWSGTPAPTVTYKWYRCLTAEAAATMTDPANGDCWAIDSATAKTYTLTASDVGYYVRGVEIASSTSGVDYAYSQTTNQVRESDTIAAGDSHTCAIRLGRVYCWGLGTSGQLGDGTLVSKSTPTGPVKLADGSILENVVTIEAQDTGTCAATVAGAMYCWGQQANGEFGTGVTSETISVPKQTFSAAGTPLTGVIAIAMADAHTCVIRTGGSLWCWGYNADGRVGDGTATNRSYPVQIIASGAQQVSADYATTCAIVNTSLKCWGVNDHNQLGDGTGTTRNAPVAVTNMSVGITDVSLGEYHVCAVKDGAAFCWGYNGYGQLGDGTTTQRATATQVVNSAAGVVFTDDVVNVDASEYNPEHSCLTKTGGVLYCFGVGGNSALANGSTANALVPSPSTLWTTGVSEVTTGYQFTCVVKDGADFCTGYNNYGQVGNATITTSAVSNGYTSLANYAGALDVAPYGGTTAVTGVSAVGSTLTGTSSGWSGFPMPTVTYQWYNCVNPGVAASSVPADCSALSGATSTTYVPVATDVNNYVRLVATATSTAGVTTQVTAAQFVGMAPDATFIERTTAPAGFIPIGTTITQFADQWDAVPAATVTNAWYRCSSTGAAVELVPTDCTLIAGATGNTYKTTQSDVGSYVRGAQIATNSVGVTTALSPTAGYVTETRTVAVGAQSTCVVKAGEVWCAGLGTAGQLGNNAILSSSTPVKVLTAANTPLTKVIDVAGVGYHYCAITETGALYCWGANGNGALGIGTTTNTSLATLVTSGTQYAAVDPGNAYTCAIKVGGALYCWGLNTSSQLGDGTVANKSVPALVTGMGSGVSQVAAGWQSTCAIKNGAAMCWGSNTNYMLGDGTATARSVPTQVGPTQVAPIVNFTSGVTDIAMSTISACLVKDGSAYCWGNAASGQIGTGATTGNAGYPVQVIATTSGTVFTSGVVDVEVSVNNNSVDSVYLTKSDGSLYAFGSQVNGVLLNAATTGNSPRPIAATGYASGVSEVSAGWGDVCVVKGGALNCAGLNDNGQLFNSPATLNTTPVTTPTAPAAFASGLGDVALAPTLVTAPTVDGTPGLANVSAGDPGAFSANPASTLTYKWYTCTLTGDVATAVPADCVASTGSGATTLNYTPNVADAGKYLRLAVTATNTAGTVTSVSAASAQVTGKGDQSIVFGPVANPAIGGAAVTLAATASSTLAVTYTSATPLVCTVAAGKVTAVAGGRCEITAAQAGDTTFNAATATLELFVDRTANVMTFTAADRAYSATPFALAASATSGLPVSYSAMPASVCTVSGSNLTMVNVGNCQITATQAGSSTVAAAAPVVVTMAIGKASQTIALNLPASLSILDTVGTALTATATSGGVVTFDVEDASICNFVNGKLVGLALGTCRVIATQAGDSKTSPVSTTFSTVVTRAPNVSSVTTTTSTPTKLTAVSVTLTFDNAVTGLTASDLTTTPTACTISSVSGSGTTYTVNLTACAEGPVSLKLAANSVSNGADGPLAAYTSPVVFTVDKTAPAVSSATTTAPALTNAATVDYTVTFAEAVTDFTAADVTNSGTATGCVPSVTAVSQLVYTVTFASCSDGTVGVKIAASAVADIATNAGPATAFAGTAAVALDRAAATITSATATAGANTKNSPVAFVVTFAEGVTGFTAADLSTTGTATGCVPSVTAVSATVYNVSVANCTDGTVGIKIAAGSVNDLAGNASPVAEFVSATTKLDTQAPTAPTVTTSAPAKTNTLPVVATITFAEPVTGFDSTDLSILGTATGCQISVSAVSATVYTATITGCTDGTVGLSIAANSVTDAASNLGPVVPAPTPVLTTIDRAAPTATAALANAMAFTNTMPIPFLVTFAEPVTGVTAADFDVIGTATGCQVSVTAVSSTVYNVAVSSCAADGTVGVKVLAAAATDNAGNTGPATVVSSATVVLDTIAPDAPTVSDMPGDFTAATEIDPIFEMDARFTYECEFDGGPVSCGAGNLHLGSVANPLALGDHELKIWVTDQAGNRSQPFSQTWNIGNYDTPAVPDAPVVERPIRTTLDVSWTEPTSSVEIPVVGYELQYNVDGISWVTAAKITDPNVTNYELTTARSGLEYEFRVKALATLAADSSDFSDSSLFDTVYMPEIASLSLAQSVLTPPAGATVTLTGVDFAKGATQVSFGTTPATVVSVSTDGTSAVVSIPPATTAGTVDINVVSGTNTFQGAGLKARAFTYTSTAAVQTLTHTPPTGLKAGAPALDLTTYFNSGAAPVYAVSPASSTICRFDGQKLVALAVGTCNYTIASPANAGYQAFAAKAFSTVIAKGDNLTTFTLPNGFTLANTPISATAYPLTATSSAGLPVVNTAAPANVCYVDAAGSLHLTAIGACTITSTSGNANFATSSVTTTIQVTKAAQTLSFVAPGAAVPGVQPVVYAPAATDVQTGFKLMTSINSGLPLTYTSMNPTVCEVDQDGVVSWIADLTKNANDPALNTCKVQVSQAGNANYAALAPTELTLVATHVATTPPPGGVITDPEVAGSIGRNGGKAVFGSDGFDVVITSKVVTITPYGEGILIGPITATVNIPYKETVKGKQVAKVQVCTTKFGITKKMTIAQGALKSKKFTTTVKCTLNAAAFAWFKAGNAIDIKATVVRDRRWPTTFLKIVGKESPRKGWPLFQTKKLYKLSIG